MFKKGDYIVTTQVDQSYTLHCAKNNYCFKQVREFKGIAPEVDLKGSKTNDNPTLSFDKSALLLDWRYATEEEAKEYDRIGKPYDTTALKTNQSTPKPVQQGVTQFKPGVWYKWPLVPNYPVSVLCGRLLYVRCTKYVDSKLHYSSRINVDGRYEEGANYCDAKGMIEVDKSEVQQWLPNDHVDKILNTQKAEEKSLVGRYLKALVDYPDAGAVKEGEIGLIKGDSYGELVACFPSQGPYHCTKNTIGSRYELMPVGFDPTVKSTHTSPQFKVGDRVKIIGNSNCSANEIGEVGVITQQKDNGNGPVWEVKVNDAYRRRGRTWTRSQDIEHYTGPLPDSHVHKEVLTYKGWDKKYVTKFAEGTSRPQSRLEHQEPILLGGRKQNNKILVI